MKKLYFILILFLALSNIYAQGNKEKIESIRVAFITKEVNLTPAEAQLFWPLYNEYIDKLEAVKTQRKESRKIMEKSATASDAEINQVLKTEVLCREKEAALFKEYQEKFKKVISPRKIADLYKAEEEFKKELIKQLKESK